jgi:hypothetical protein
MRDLFAGYFRPSAEEFAVMWKTGLIVPDTNILLHMLRYKKETREEVFSTLAAFKPRLWAPHQVAFEFLRGWRSVDADNRGAYERLRKKIRSTGSTLATDFDQASRHQIIDPKVEKAKIETFIKSLSVFRRRRKEASNL